MQFSGLARRSFHTTRVALAEEAAGAAAGNFVLNFSVPRQPLLQNEEVVRVTVPGRAGVYGIAKNSPPTVSELRPGVVSIDFAEKDREVFFIPGGFAFSDKNSVDISTPEAVSLNDVDPEAVKREYEAAKAKKDAAQAGSKEAAQADIQIELYRSLAFELNISL